MNTNASSLAYHVTPAALDELERCAQSLVGVVGLGEAQDRLARGMLIEALRRTAGNFTQTAKLLGVQRQAVQQMATRHGLAAWAVSLRSKLETSSPPRDIHGQNLASEPPHPAGPTPARAK